MINRSGKITINVGGLVLITLLILVCFGKASFWHLILFPFYWLIGTLGVIIGIVLLVFMIIGGIWLVCKLIGK
ncbi:MAG: hypothetical protein DRO67_02695 [Candidatus Asgardarchaeum californiense]|nr:MAG: hypothetical protein DRO67_02695 [Candidatus Asgardarchaeum californiense]